jgi:2,5-diamino-6-(ribosylamino)-4(3H)-pyrimidinone 5'-phosphate reductase
MSSKSKTQKPKPRGQDRPFVFLNVATTADGKLAPPNRHFVPFSSRRDQEFLYELRTRADAVMAGARTVDSVPVTLGPGAKKYRALRRKNGLAEFNLRVIVSGSGSINPRAEIFRHKFSPLIILVTQRASRARVQRLEKLGAIVYVCGKKEINFPEALHWIREQWGVKRLLCEGGGEINDALLRAGLVDEIYLTLCPKIFGGRTAPTMVDGAGASTLNAATQLQLKSRRRAGDEMHLCYSAGTRNFKAL